MYGLKDVLGMGGRGANQTSGLMLNLYCTVLVVTVVEENVVVGVESPEDSVDVVVIAVDSVDTAVEKAEVVEADCVSDGVRVIPVPVDVEFVVDKFGEGRGMKIIANVPPVRSTTTTSIATTRLIPLRDAGWA